MPNPKLRFKQNDGSAYSDWESESFGSAFTLLPNNTLSRSELAYEQDGIHNIHYGDILTVFSDYVDVSNTQLPTINEPGKLRNLANAKLQNGDVIIADTAEDDTVGKAIEIANCQENEVVSGLHTIACRPHEEIFASKYLGYYLNSPSFHDQLRPLMQGIKVTSIGRTPLEKETTLSFPNFEEQQKIADFFSNLDEAITTNEAEIAALEQEKEGATQKLFSQEVRFARKDGSKFPDWEAHELKEFFDERNEQTSDEAVLLSVAIAKGVVKQSDTNKRDTSSKDKSNYKVVHKGDIPYNSMRMWQGAFGLSQLDGIVSPAYTVLKPKENTCSGFFVALFKLRSTLNIFTRYSQGLTSDTWNLKYSILSSLQFRVPCLEEQQKIADFLSAFDEAIDLAKQELELWKLLKKGLMQQMFV